MRATWTLALALALAAASPGAAEPPLVDDHGAAGATDWSRGLVVARGAATADLRARSPAVARVGAERRARERARGRLLELAAAVPRAGGGTVAEAVARRPGAAARLAEAATAAIDVDIDYAADGTVVARLGLPLEAIRTALEPAPPGPPAATGDVTGLVVRADGVVDAPALGFELVAGQERYAAPVIFARPGATTDPRLGDRIVEARARGRDGASLALDLEPEALAQARGAGALVVIVAASE